MAATQYGSYQKYSNTLDNNMPSYKRYIYFIIDNNSKIYSKDKYLQLEIKHIIESFNNCDYQVFCIIDNSNGINSELKLDYTSPKNEKYTIILKLENKNINIKKEIFFLFDFDYKYYFTSKKFDLKLGDIGKLIIFKKAIKKYEFFKDITEKTQLSLFEEGLDLLNKDDNKNNFLFLLNLFCINKDDIKIISTITQKFNINSANSANNNQYDYYNEEKNDIEDDMNSVNLNILNNQNDKNKVKKYFLFLLYYYTNYNNNDKVQNFLKDLYLQNETKEIILEILKENSWYFNSKITIPNENIIKDLIERANSFKTIEYSLNYIDDILLYLNVIKDNLKTIEKAFYKQNKYLIIGSNIINKNKYKINEISLCINEIIQYQLNKKKVFILFSNLFWSTYSSDCELKKSNRENIQNYILLNNCIKGYLNLKKFCYYEKLGENFVSNSNYFDDSIHRIIEDLIWKNQISSNKEKLEFLLNKDPYYIENYKNNKRNEKIFQKIDVFDKDCDKIFENKKLDDLFIDSESKYNNFLDYIFQKVDDFFKFKKIFNLFNINKKNDSFIKKNYKKIRRYTK